MAKLNYIVVIFTIFVISLIPFIEMDSVYAQEGNLAEILKFEKGIIFETSSATGGFLVFEGVVRDRGGDPLPGLQVTIGNSGGTLGDFTDKDGYFSFLANPGNYQLRVRDVGNTNNPTIPNSFGVLVPDFRLNSNTYQDLTLQNVFLDVLVLDSSGIPVSGAKITATGDDEDNSFEIFQGTFADMIMSDVGLTNDLGIARLSLFPLSEAALIIEPPNKGDFPLFSVREFSVFEDTEMTVQSSNPVKIKGKITDRDGNPVSNLQVALDGYYIPDFNRFTNDDGRFGFSVAPDFYHFRLKSPSHIDTPNFPDYFSLIITQMDFRKDTVNDLTLNNSFFDVTVLDFEGNPVSGSSISAVGSDYKSSGFIPGKKVDFVFNDSGVTDNSGFSRLEVFAWSEVSLTINPPPGSGFSPIKVKDILVKGDISRTFVFGVENASNGENATVNIPSGSSVPGCETNTTCFLPSDIKIDSGKTVTWRNLDSAAHTVTSGSASVGPSGKFDSSLLMSQKTFSHTFDDEGEFDYFCMVHPWMEGTVKVGGSPAEDDEIEQEGSDGINDFDSAQVDVSSESFVSGNSASVSIPKGVSVPGCETSLTCFTPSSLIIIKGATITWSNDDSAAHTVTAGSAAKGPSGFFDSSLFMAGTIFSHTFDTLGTFDYFCMVHPWMTGNVTVIDQTPVSSSGTNQWDTRPTFGMSHESNYIQIVENGFTFNSDQFSITNNHHTKFEEQSLTIGAINSFSATVYADKKLKVQEFLFGIPNVGESHLAELGIEVWYDIDGNVDDVKVIQKTEVIDASSLVVNHAKTKCNPLDKDSKCDTTVISMKFQEPLKDKVMAIKAIDFEKRDQRTYLNDGFDISGVSLNPMLTKMIPSNVRDQGIIQVTQTAKYSPYWVSEDGRMFEMNSFGSFSQVNYDFKRFQDTGTPYTRLHSGFVGIIEYEQKRASKVFDSRELISELPEIFTYTFPESRERLTPEIHSKMLEEEEIAKKILEESNKQTRW